MVSGTQQTKQRSRTPCPLRLLVGIPTAGRRDILIETLGLLGRQTRRPDKVLICASSPNDFEGCLRSDLDVPTAVVMREPGLPRQRNAVLELARGFDLVAFFDDDFFPAPDYLANAEALFARDPRIVVATGIVLADGIHGPGLTPAQAHRRLSETCHRHGDTLEPRFGAYGCNMVVRLAPVMAHGLRFDERLPLYGWQEDTDFSRQLAPFGDIVRSSALAGVHLGVKQGRSSGVRLGYSQLANPLYLIGKGTMSVSLGARLMTQNVLANLARSLWPEPYVDRRGRLKGNWIAALDLVKGRLNPQRVLQLD